MGLIRKALSASTFGAVDFRSDKERIALYTKQTRDAVIGEQAHTVRGATNLMLGGSPGSGGSALRVKPGSPLARLMARKQPPPAAPPPPGFYDDPHDPTRTRWWDGAAWTNVSQPRDPTG